MLIEFKCPHCQNFFVVEESEINCRIVRHFAFRDGTQLNPHAPKQDCERVVQEDLGYGCAKPCFLTNEAGVWEARMCDYV